MSTEFRVNVVVNNTAKAKTGGFQVKKMTLSAAMLALWARPPLPLIRSR